MANPSGPNYERTRRVFVVHGRNKAARVAMFTFLRSIGLIPIEWSQAIAMTRKASPYIGDVLDVALEAAQAVVVLLTPDEIASLRAEYADADDEIETTPSAQARPNVLFEAGLALGRAPDRTVLAELGKVRHFSDIAGRHVVRIDNSIASRQELAQRLGTAGCAVDLTGTDWHTAGDFVAPRAPAPNVYRPSDTQQHQFSDPQQLTHSPTSGPATITTEKIILGGTKEISLSNVAVRTGRRGYEVVGEATNNDAFEHSAVHVQATFYAIDGRILAAATDSVMQLAAGDTRTFTIDVRDDVSHHTSVKVQVTLVL